MTFRFASTERRSTFACSLDGGRFEACRSPRSYAGLEDGRHSFAVRARDAAGNRDPAPTRRVWIVDTVAPATTIVSRPAARLGRSTAAFSFTASEEGSTFECRLDGRRFGVCSSPRVYRRLSLGRHTFRVRARDRAGNVDKTPSLWTWEVFDRTPPATTITAGPSGAVRSRSAAFAFASNERGSTFECSLDGAAYTPCGSPKSYAHLREGGHTFRVRARDAAANADRTPATRRWRVDTRRPNTSILSGPSGLVSGRSARFTFSSTERGSTFQCSLDRAPFSACGSPWRYGALRPGAHEFRVRAIDAAGNVDLSSAKRRWTIQR